MKHYIFLLASLALLLPACEKNDSGDDEEFLENIDPEIAAISAKLDIDDPNSRYASFEFQTDGTYIVSEYVDDVAAQGLRLQTRSSLKGLKLPASPFLRTFDPMHPQLRAESRRMTIHVGRYSLEGSVIQLTDFGLIDKFTVTADEFSFSFKPDGSLESVEYVATKAPVIHTSNRTNALCRMWQIENIGFNSTGMTSEMEAMYELMLGSGWQDALSELLYSMVSFELDGKTVTLCAMLSKAGTYLSLFRDGDGNYFTEVTDEWGFALSTVVGTWEWTGSDEKQIRWAQEGSYGMEGGDGIADVTELSLTRLVLTGTTSADGFGMGYIEEFKAVNSF
jgi:hypothetical protein